LSRNTEGWKCVGAIIVPQLPWLTCFGEVL
jgi:hypothetical protein